MRLVWVRTFIIFTVDMSRLFVNPSPAFIQLNWKSENDSTVNYAPHFQMFGVIFFSLGDPLAVGQGALLPFNSVGTII